MNSKRPAGEAPSSFRIPKSWVVLILIIVGAMAFLALYANIQHFRRERVETVVVVPATPSVLPLPQATEGGSATPTPASSEGTAQ